MIEETEDTNCPFCKLNSDKIISEFPFSYAIYDNYPVNIGHVLIVTKRHCECYFDLSIEEQSSCWQQLNEVKNLIQQKYNPDGFNIGININKAAGQTVSHCHIHLIPRYYGDINDPKGGVRSVIPNKKCY